MLEEILAYLNNWFLTEIYEDTFVIENGSMELSFLKIGQYYRIFNSTFNDGVYKYGDEELIDEIFDGVIWALAIPKALLSIEEEIATWNTKYGDIVSGPYSSESFDGYSYTKRSSGSDDEDTSWISAFKKRLAPYRKLRETAPIAPTDPPVPTYHRPFNPDFPWR